MELRFNDKTYEAQRESGVCEGCVFAFADSCPPANCTGIIWTEKSPTSDTVLSSPRSGKAPTPSHTNPLGIGDVNSDTKGSGARFNSGKPDLSLVPLRVIAECYSAPDERNSDAAVFALSLLGRYQETHDTSHLFKCLAVLGFDGWSECARVFEYGKRKYAAWNWAKGMPWSVPLACAARHLVLGIIAGEERDAESGLPHRGHVFCNVVMLLQYAKTYPEGNDLPPVELL